MFGDSSENCIYLNAIEVGPDDIYTPAHVYKCASGEWDLGAFDPALGVDTPGLANLECGAPPALCGDPASGDRFEAGSPGCDDEICCDLVTSLDPFCATDSWDETCVSHALNMCLPLGNAPELPRWRDHLRERYGPRFDRFVHPRFARDRASLRFRER